MTDLSMIKKAGTVATSAAGLSVSTIPLIFGSIGILFAPLADQFGWSRGQIGLAITSYVLGTILASPIIGRLIDRIGAKPVILMSTALFGVSLLALPPLVDSLPALYAVYFAFAVLGAGASPIAYSKIIAGQFEAKRGLALGVALSGVGVGTSLFPVIGQAVLSANDWTSLFFQAGLLILILIFPVLWLGLPGNHSVGGSKMSGLTVLRSALRDERFLKMGAAFLLVGLGYTGMATQLVPLMIDKGLSRPDAAGMQFLLGLTVIVGRLLSGFLLDHVSPRLVAAAAIVATACGVGLLIYLPFGPMSFVGIVLLGLSAGAEIDVMAYMTARYFGLDRYGSLYGTLNSAYFIGTAIGPFAAAMSFDLSGSYHFAGAGLIASLSLAAFVIIGLGEGASGGRGTASFGDDVGRAPRDRPSDS